MQLTLNTHIEATPGTCGGKPRITGTRITVADVAVMYLRLGQCLELIATKYDLPLAAVYAAMSYYYDHREEIDRRLAEDAAWVEALQRQQPSRLQERLRSLQGE